ncbi:VOC family protein [Sphingorhabdus contaminans]|uniref:VOC family protein n=1 Tax=Sphingorhabdus contaminans TaxID=1343899 RepID=UPI003D2B76B2
MISSERIAHVGITVADMNRALTFLAKLGFELQARITPFDPQAVEGITRVPGAIVRELAYVVLDGFQFELLEYAQPERSKIQRRVCDTGYFHFALQVDDISAVQAQLDADDPPYTVRQGPASGQKATYIYGPDGLTVELIEKRKDDHAHHDRR